MNSKMEGTESFEFPSALESEVASALLLLSSINSSPLYTVENGMKQKKNFLRFKILNSHPPERSTLSSSSSTVTMSDNGGKQRKVIAMFSKFHHEMTTIKVVKKPRSKKFCISNRQKNISGKQAMKVEPSESVSASSSLSSGSSSVISSAGSSRNVMINRQPSGKYLFLTPAKDLKRKPALGSAHMRRRADAILKVLSSRGRASEVKIRELLGDSPSTSKALRILLNLEQVKRSGGGGRTDPYIYMIA